KFKLSHGLFIDQNSVEQSYQTAFHVNSAPIVKNEIQQSIKLRNITQKFDSLLLSQGIVIPDSIQNLPFNSKILDLSATNDLYCEILCEQISIDFNIQSLKPTAQLISMIKAALNSKTPIDKLENVYRIFGHLIPTKVIIGNKLKRLVCFPENKLDEKIKINNEHEFMEFSEKENMLLKVWREKMRPFDSSYMFAIDSTPIEISQIPSWLELNKRNKSEWRIIKLFTVPLHKILEIEHQKKIEYFYQKQDCILMTGKNSIADYDAGYLQIDFENVLKSNNYHLFGALVGSDDVKLADVFIRFSLKSIVGFSVSWHDFRKNYNQELEECKKRSYFLQWILIGCPIEIGYFDPVYHNLRIKHGIKKMKLTLDNVLKPVNSEDMLYSGTWIADINVDKLSYSHKNIILCEAECGLAPSIFFFNTNIASYRDTGLIKIYVKTINEEVFEFIKEYKELDVKIRHCVIFFENEVFVNSVLWNISHSLESF
ncbi:6749_t:CDS:2, partial [Ambispora leptoticha]